MPDAPAVSRKGPLFIHGMLGMGDNIYQRPFVRAACHRRDVWLVTPWPELYADLPVRPVQPSTKLRTQAKNASRQAESTWSKPPGDAVSARFAYGTREFREGSIVDAHEQAFPLDGYPFVFDLPDFGPAPVSSDRPIALIRPVTHRREWSAPARSPDPRYIAEAADILHRMGYHIVSVADLEDGQEALVGPEPWADERYHRGEVPVAELIALVRHAALCVGGVGWIVPAAIATGTPLIVIAGGLGMHNAPEKVTDPRMDLTRTRWLLPDNYCRCENMHHDCPKSIGNFDLRFQGAVREVVHGA